MAEVKVQDGESIESALRTQRSGESPDGTPGVSRVRRVRARTASDYGSGQIETMEHAARAAKSNVSARLVKWHHATLPASDRRFDSCIGQFGEVSE